VRSNPVMLWTSTDGAKWTRVADVSMFGGGTIANVTFGADGFVAVGDSGWDSPAIWYSNFGTTWQRLTLPSSTFNAAHFSSVSATTYGDATTSGYALGGSIGGTAPVSGGVAAPNTGLAAAWWSPDGRTWTKATVNRNPGVGRVWRHRCRFQRVGRGRIGRGRKGRRCMDFNRWPDMAADRVGLLRAPTPEAGVTTLPGLIVRSDGRHLVAIDEDQSSILMWISSDGVNWRRLAFSGSTDTIPSTYGNAYAVPDGLIVLVSRARPRQCRLALDRNRVGPALRARGGPRPPTRAITHCSC